MPIATETHEAVDFLVRNGQLPDRDLTRELIYQGIQTKIYGPIFEGMLQYGKVLVEGGHLDPHAAAGGAQITAGLYVESNGRYLRQDNVLDGDALVKHQQAVLNGDLPLVPLDVQMDPANSIHQVESSDRVFCGDINNIGYQGAAGAMNYGRVFDQQTMTSGDELVDKLEDEQTPQEVEEISYDGMTHLDASNQNLAHTVEGVIRYAAITGKRVRIFDIGSGHGATIGAMIHRIVHKMDMELPEIAITCIEQTPHFYSQLVDFVKSPKGASAIGLEAIETDDFRRYLSQFGALTTVYGNAPKILAEMDTTGIGGPDEIVINVANYVRHRVASDKKLAEIQQFAAFDNVVYLTGDLRQNTSVINRRHFNLAANGPLNTGNRHFEAMLRGAGYEVINLAELQPSAIDVRLGKHLVPDSFNPDRDGHLWIGVRGNAAYSSLALVHPHHDAQFGIQEAPGLVRV